MLVDVGTNTEVVVSRGARIAGGLVPGGAGVRGRARPYGMPGADGAIERVRS